MKIALAQINPIVGDLEHNFKIIVDNIQKARKAKVELLVLPELSLLGYPPKDLLLKEDFFKKQNYYIDELAIYTDEDFAILLGVASKNGAYGKKLFNSLVFLHEGKVKTTASKSLLPNYDVFDETRYFEAAKSPTVIDYKDIKFGLSICEDIWIEAYPSMYTRDPIGEMVGDGADIIINAAASPFVTDKPKRRERLLSNAAKRYKKPIIYVNQIGANDQLIFDGRSLILNKRGDLLHSLKSFEEDFYVVDTCDLAVDEKFVGNKVEYLSTDLEPSLDEVTKVNLSDIKNALVLGVRDYVHKCGFEDIVLGLSGGIDSALVLALATEALGAEHVHAISMPSKYTSQESIDYAIELAQNLGLLKASEDPHKAKIKEGAKFEIIPITDLHSEIHDLMPQVIDHQADENIQSRLRGNILMAFSNTMQAMLLNTGNKSEIAVGYCTLYGDTCGGLSVIGDLLKTTVFKLSEFINEDAAREIIPQKIIDRPPTAELKADQCDQDTLPPYELLDKIILLYVQEMRSVDEIVKHGVDEQTVLRVLNMIDRAEYKRQQLPPALKIAGKAFGTGRRMSIAQRFVHQG